MKRLFTRLTAALVLAAGALSALAQPGAAPLGEAAIVLFRHAEAPGVGDPPGFRLDDCSTQRNLDETGRAQARRIGEAVRVQGVRVGAVIHSQWCRTRDTAALAFPQHPRTDDPDFNSFFGNASQSEAQTARALATLAAWRGPGALVVVTHQVNVTALTGAYLASGEGLVVRIPANGRRAEVVGRLPPPSGR